MTVDLKGKALADASDRFGVPDDRARQVLSDLWDSAFEQGRLDAVDELQDQLLRLDEIAIRPGMPSLTGSTRAKVPAIEELRSCKSLHEER